MNIASTQQLTPPNQWTQLLQKVAPTSEFLAFSKSQILSLSNSPETPKFKELVKLLPTVYKKYEQNCQYFRQLLLLLYLLLLKGYSYGNQESNTFTNICLITLEQLLKYRALVILSMWENNILAQFVSWYSQWLQLLIPSILAAMANRNRRQKKQKDKQGEYETKNRSLISVLQSINTKSNSSLNIKQSDTSKNYDHILIIFEALLVHRIRAHLNCQSLFQFDSIIRKLYSPMKLKLVYQGRGCISHINTKQKQREDRQRQLNQNRIIQISGLFPARIDQTGWKLIQLQITPQQKNSGLKLKKCQSKKPMPHWVVEAFETPKPQQMKISLSTVLSKMKALQTYQFLCNLQLYGSSPHIEILNQFIPDEKLLQFFTKFLLGENLAQSAKQLLNWKIQGSMAYSYRNAKFMQILQLCMNQAMKLNGVGEREVFVQEFRKKVVGVAKEKPQGDTNNGNKK